LKFKAKIQSIKQYLHYTWISKSKYRIHSPFVFQFIGNILESKDNSVFSINKKIIKYYSKNINTVSIVENAGSGSKTLGTKAVEIQEYIKKVGLPEKYGKVLANISKFYACKNIIELGTSLGISTTYLASNTKSEIYTIEANPSIYKMSKEALTSMEITHVHCINGYFDEELPKLLQDLQNVSLVFIDGDHNKEATLRYFNMCLHHIDEASILVFDDIYWSEEMKEAWEEIKKHEKVRLSIDLFRMGIVFFRKEQFVKEDFVLWY
jgi:predicted O-methyltransferase YrrM